MADRARRIPVLTTPGELSATVRRAGSLFLFCDYDGTLAPIAPTPAQARPDPALPGLLARLAPAPGICAAVISGRDLSDLAGLLPVPGLWLAGCHGAELRRPDGETETLCRPEVRPALEEAARRLRLILAGRRGFLLEEKKYSLALHYRLADPGEAPAVLEAFRQAAGAAARRHGLIFTPGKKVLELRPRNVHKGIAVQRLLEGCPGALPLYLGDDVTDESAFVALAERRAAVTVLVSAEPRPSAARYRLPDPAAVTGFLEQLAPAQK